MISATRRIQFCSGHRVHGHESKCAHLHGHNYVVLATCHAPQLDGVGRVVDFSFIKGLLGNWIEEYWDHRMLLWDDDPVFKGGWAVPRDIKRVPERTYPPRMEAGTAWLWFPEKQHGVVRVPFNPTAENMARFLLELGNELLEGLREGGPADQPLKDVRFVRVRVWETENCYADATDEKWVLSLNGDAE